MTTTDSMRRATAALFIDGQQSTDGAIAICWRPDGRGSDNGRMPPQLVALAADETAARRLVDGWGPVLPGAVDKAAGRVLAATVAYREDIGRLRSLVTDLQSKLQSITEERDMLDTAVKALSSGAEARPPRAAPARGKSEAKADYRTAAEVWRAGDVLKRAGRAAFKRSRGPQTVTVLFADGIEMRVSTYLDGQEGRNAAAQFARSVRQAEPVPMVEILRRRARGETGQAPEWIRDTKGAWRKILIGSCPDVLSVEFVEG